MSATPISSHVVAEAVIAGRYAKACVGSAFCSSELTAQSDARALAVLIIGLQRMNALNEVLGYGFSEELLQLCGDRLESALRQEDRLLRVSRDEFVILLNSVESVTNVRSVAERLLNLIQRPFVIRGEVADITANVGIAIGAEGGQGPDGLLRRAGIALQSAVIQGPGTLDFFEPAMESRALTRHALRGELRKALLLRQFEVHYQPQVDVRTQALAGFEALLRWRHPTLGYISPGDFIPLAEEIGMIGPIGEWVLRTACKQAAQLPEELIVAVNASPLQFRSNAFLRTVEQALAHAGLAARRLEIEVTEGVLLQSSGSALSTLDTLHKIGVRLAMDDFGTGYSSLSQLSKAPFDTIKIDRSLVGGTVQQRAIVRSIVVLGNGLGMSTLAEGLETEEQLQNIQSDGCNSAQGYLFGKAMPAHELAGVVTRFSQQAAVGRPLSR